MIVRAASIALAVAILVALIVIATVADRAAGPAATASPTLPLVSFAATAPPPPTASARPTTSPVATAALPIATDLQGVHERLRARVAAPPLRSDPRVTAAAQRHAEYLDLNAASGHDETPDRRGFTGATVRERLAAQGYDVGASFASEVATRASSDAVGSLWDAPYHRLGLMHPHAVIAGWGRSGTSTVGVIVYDFASASPPLVRSPAAGERDVPAAWSGVEFPDVLPAGAQRPTGYPIMAVWSGARTVTLRAASLTRVRDGAMVPLHVVPQLYEPDYQAVVPQRPLDAATTYRARFDVTLSGSEVAEEWEFTTAAR